VKKQKTYIKRLSIIPIQSFVKAFADKIETQVGTNRICQNVT
jgi:hypothetical protein